jgi:putative DNA primase/helicase
VSMREVIDAATGKWPGILTAFGVDAKYLRNRQGPCPACGGTDRFRFDDKGTGSFFCNNCGPGYGLKLLANITGKAERDLAQEVAALVGNLPADPVKPAGDMRKKIAWIQRSLLPVRKVPEVLRYLEARGLKPTAHLGALKAVRYYDEGKLVGEFPALVASFCSPAGDLLTYHLTHVQDGRKAPVAAPKKLLTPLGGLDGGALRLTRLYPSLGIAEGVETALAVMRDFQVPCWAAYSAGMLQKFTPPPEVKAVTIFGDNDASFTGQTAAFALAKRLRGMGLAAEVRIPERPGDFADAPKEKAAV